INCPHLCFYANKATDFNALSALHQKAKTNDLYEIEGDHYSIMQSPSLDSWVKIMKEWIKAESSS
ncbi:MAG: hypothetical protein OEZ58_20285, partial [Gammaproteobacteria bacterium]|nr:hypothetical protein [Gammaproteobacteria bacterium]